MVAMCRTVAGSSFSGGVQLLVATGTVHCPSWSVTWNVKACPKTSSSNTLLGRKNGAIFQARGWETRSVKPELWESHCPKACKPAVICKGCNKDLWSVCKVLSDRRVESAVRARTRCSDTNKYCQLQPCPTLRQALGGFFAYTCFVASAVLFAHAAAPCM